MLVDLARNDIGRVCEYGVQVADLMVIERYSHVMHIVGSVTDQLCADKIPYDLLRTTFPAGTLTGAPKIRAMQIIGEFEQTTRGPTVARSVTSVSTATSTAASPSAPPCSRTAKPTSKRRRRVNDSVEAEFQETVNKAKAMIKAVALAGIRLAASMPHFRIAPGVKTCLTAQPFKRTAHYGLNDP